MKKKFNLGFTLAEVLITLVIIGVVAAVTIPVLHANYTEREKITRVKKAYSTLANAMTLVKANGGDTIFEVKDGSNDNVKEWFDTYLAPYLITTKVCYDSRGCWNEGDTKYLNGHNTNWNRPGIGDGYNIVTAVLNDGTFINIDVHTTAEYFGVDSHNLNAVVVSFDINGARKPNVVGRDIFVAVFTDDGFVPAYKNKTGAQIDADCSNSGTGISCINKYLYEM